MCLCTLSADSFVVFAPASNYPPCLIKAHSLPQAVELGVVGLGMGEQCWLSIVFGRHRAIIWYAFGVELVKFQGGGVVVHRD